MYLTQAFALLLVLFGMTSSQTTDCRPDDNCSPPDCRCWNDARIPGGLEASETPQTVLVTFEYAVNSANVDFYTSLFQNVVNPNQCPGVGTFFVQTTSSDMDVVKALADNGHEIGTTTVDGTLPATQEQWINTVRQVRSTVTNSGIPQAQVIGFRSPELRPGGLEEFVALSQEGYLYDASCTTSTRDDQSTLIWPYTYDFAPGPACDNGEGPEQQFPGKWQVLIADLEFNNTKCATPSACAEVVTQKDAFDLFYNSFVKHYEGSRSPFVIVIDPQWVTNDDKREGTRQFLDYVRAAFEDTWVLTVRQALEWIRDPVDNVNATANYAPWSCV